MTPRLFNLLLDEFTDQQDREDYRAGIVASTYARASFKDFRGGPEAFFPNLKEVTKKGPKKGMNPEALASLFRAWANVHNRKLAEKEKQADAS